MLALKIQVPVPKRITGFRQIILPFKIEVWMWLGKKYNNRVTQSKLTYIGKSKIRLGGLSFFLGCKNAAENENKLRPPKHIFAVPNMWPEICMFRVIAILISKF